MVSLGVSGVLIVLSKRAFKKSWCLIAVNLGPNVVWRTVWLQIDHDAVLGWIWMSISYKGLEMTSRSWFPVGLLSITVSDHCANQDRDKYQFGKTKIFFRAGQVAYLEKLRSDRLKACGILIQKRVRGWLAKRRYFKIRRTALLVQTYGRGFLARK